MCVLKLNAHAQGRTEQTGEKWGGGLPGRSPGMQHKGGYGSQREVLRCVSPEKYTCGIYLRNHQQRYEYAPTVPQGLQTPRASIGSRQLQQARVRPRFAIIPVGGQSGIKPRSARNWRTPDKLTRFIETAASSFLEPVKAGNFWLIFMPFFFNYPIRRDNQCSTSSSTFGPS